MDGWLRSSSLGPSSGDAADLEHVGVRGDVEREVRVLLDDEHREPLLLVQLAHDRGRSRA